MTVLGAIVKEFGQIGTKNYRKFTTQVINGKTVTQAFDSEGKEVLKRIKAFDTIKVGDKTVRQKKTVKIENHENELFKVRSSVGTIEQTSRIYGSDGKLLGGMKEFKEATTFGERGCKDWSTLDNPLEKIKDGDRIVTKYTGNMETTDNLTRTYFKDGLRSQRNFRLGYQDPYDPERTILFNNKGLPIPPSFESSGTAWRGSVGSAPERARNRAENKSLQEMVKMAQEDSEKIKNTWFGKKYGDPGYFEDYEKCYGNPKLADKIFYPHQKLNFLNPQEVAKPQAVQNTEATAPTDLNNVLNDLSKFL